MSVRFSDEEREKGSMNTMYTPIMYQKPLKSVGNHAYALIKYP